MASHETEVSQLLESWNRGDPEALETLMPLIIDDLRSIARRYFEREAPDHTLQPTALVNELYLRLVDRRSVHWESPSHFFGATAQIMRRLLVDHARHRKAAKRGGGAPKLPIEDLPVFVRHDPEEILRVAYKTEMLHYGLITYSMVTAAALALKPSPNVESNETPFCEHSSSMKPAAAAERLP